MTKKINRSLLISVLALAAACVFAVGAVFAWFSLSRRSASEGFDIKVLGTKAANVGITVDGEAQSPDIRYEGVIPGRVFHISLSVLEGTDQALYFAILDPEGDVLDADGTKIADFLDVFCITVRTEYLLEAFRARFADDPAGLAALAARLDWFDADGNVLDAVAPVTSAGVLSGFRAGETEAVKVRYSLNLLKWTNFGTAETAEKICVPVVWNYTANAGVGVAFDLEFAEQTFEPSDVDINVFQNRMFALRKFYIDTKRGAV